MASAWFPFPLNRGLIHGFLFLVILFHLSAAAVAQSSSPARMLSNATDLAALLAFKSQADLGGVLSPSWAASRGGFCTGWKGVICSPRRPRVTELSLPGASLSGTFPPILGNLSFLVHLDLSDNQLSGPLLASALAGLRRLRHLNLSHNALRGSLPAELGGLPSLQFINLESNNLAGSIPPSVWRMASLQTLILSENSLSGEIPRDLSLPSITELTFSTNQLSGPIPRELGELSTLQILQLDDNLFTGAIPGELGNLSELQYLFLDVNGLSGGIPPALGNLTSLVSLSLRQTGIQGEIPVELGKLGGQLSWFSVAANNLTGKFPDAVYNMSSLSTLVLSQNRFSGALPDDFGRRLSPTITDLYINLNRFAGRIPASLSNLSSISNLELSYNLFQGTAPRGLGKLQQLTTLNLQNNSLNGTLDDFLGDLTACRQLRELNVQVNIFSGNLPAGPIGNFSKTKLYRFAADGNDLEGNIPSTFGNFTFFQTLTMAYNAFSGPIPPEVVALNGLQRLYLQGNQLQMGIPAAIGAAKDLGLLYLQSNNLSGAIPASIGNLSQLTELDLSQNSLQSTLPPGLWRLSALFRLNVAQNRLVGQLPDTLDGLPNLVYLNVSRNYFSGGIPAAIGKLQMLQDLRMANNNLSGTIPSTLQNLTTLKVLDLSFNRLGGKIPTERMFSNVSAGITGESFAGNLALCGASWFGLPSCEAGADHGGRRKFVVPVIVAAAVLFVGVLVLLVFLFFRMVRRKKKAKQSILDQLPEEVMPAYMMISRHELAMATDGFSDGNLIGAGSVGKVYRGMLADGTPVAVKVIDLQMGDAAWRSFDAECRVIRSVRHRNLVGIITICSILDDFRALVFPLMPNGNLDGWIHPSSGGGPRLSLVQRVGVAADVALALEYLHHGCSETVIHCDLKPSNVLLDAEMVAHVGDFGIAKVVAEQSRAATRTSAPGTFGYMAPEYGTAGRVTTKGDVYSFGILVLEMFTGVRPTDARFTGDMNLRRWVAAAFPGALAGVVDGFLLAEEQPSEPSSGSIGSTAAAGGGSTSGGSGTTSGGYLTKSENDHRSSARSFGGWEELRQRCLVAVLELGLNCSSESSKERPDMAEVAAQLKKFREELLSSPR